MSALSKTLVLLALACTFVLVAGCAKDQPIVPVKGPGGDDLTNAPQWVNDAEGAFPGDRGKVLYAVGVSATALNPALTRRRAESDARRQLAAILKVRVDSMLKDWMASSTDYVKPENTTSKQFTEAVTREVTTATLVGAKPAKWWTSPKGDVYCLMSLAQDDAFFNAIQEKAKKALQSMEQAQQEAMLKGKMEDAIANLDQYLDKQQQQAQK